MATMPQYTVPDDLVDALRAHYGEDTDGMTDKDVGAYHLRQTTGPLLKAHRRRQDAGVKTARGARESGNAARATSQAQADQTVKDAEAASDLAALSDAASIA